MRFIGSILCIILFLVSFAYAEDQQTVIAISTANSLIIKLAPSASYHEGVNLNARIIDHANGALLNEITVKGSDITRDNYGFYSFRIDGLQPKLWSPQNPHLYDVNITSADGNLIGKTKCGFRTFEIKDRQFYLNGKPIFLRSIPINPPGRELPEESDKDPEFIRGYLQMIKSVGLNMIRTDTKEWLDACDEIGLMVFTGRYGPAPGGNGHKVPDDYESTLTSYRGMFPELAAHPSVVIYVLTNEVDYKTTTYKDFLSRIREDLRAFDPTRPVIGNAGFGMGEPGEIYDVHAYYGWYGGNLQDWYRVYSEYLRRAAKVDKPLTFTELVGAYTSDDGYFLTMSKQMSTMLRWLGTAEDQRRASMDYQAELVKQTVEIGRRLRKPDAGIAGIMPFTYFLGWTKAHKSTDLTLKTAYLTLKTAFQPVLISPECWQSSIYAGDTLKFRMCVVNDDDTYRDLPPTKAEIQLVTPDGEIITSTAVSFEAVPYYSNTWADVSLSIPEKVSVKSCYAGHCTVRCSLVDNGKTISTNNFNVLVVCKDYAKVTNAHVMLYDPANTTAKALREIGVEFDKLTDLTSLPQKGVLVIGEEALTTGRYPDKSAVNDFLNRGGRILCLRQTPDNWNSDWLPANLTLAKRPLTYIHPIDDNGITFSPELPEARDMRFWNSLGASEDGVPDICPVLAPIKPASVKDLAMCRVWAGCDRLMSSAAVMEVYQGRGSAVLSQFRCVERISNDPVAAKVLASLINYVVSPNNHELYDLTWPVKWDLEAVRCGVFVSNLQGFLPHSKTYKHDGSSKGLLGEDHRIDGFTMVGDYSFTSNNWIRPIPDPKTEGWGIFYGRISKPVKHFEVQVTNVSNEPAVIKLKLDGVDIGRPVTIPAEGKQLVTWNVDRQPGPVEVELRGDQDLVITETCFR